MVHIRFGELRIGTVSNSSGIFSGSNKLHKFKHVSKQNQAFGMVQGEDSLVLDNHAVLEDRDLSDTDSTVKNPKP
ncbi:MAG: hypothetical protein JWR03_2399 [Cohnella sp.]|jgi:hypothetical protein|nr:hypothetical protein [Cohnella sp.]